MSQNNILKILKTTQEANAILTKAGGKVILSSFHTAKQIANLYKDAGLKAFGLSKDLVLKTVELTISNQKEILKTSGNAIKAAAQSIRDGAEPELKTMTTADLKKVPVKRNAVVKKK